MTVTIAWTHLSWEDGNGNTDKNMINNLLHRKLQITKELPLIITLQCEILALVWLFGPANVTFWTCQCDFSAQRLFPASGTLPQIKKNI